MINKAMELFERLVVAFETLADNAARIVIGTPPIQQEKIPDPGTASPTATKNEREAIKQELKDLGIDFNESTRTAGLKTKLEKAKAALEARLETNPANVDPAALEPKVEDPLPTQAPAPSPGDNIGITEADIRTALADYMARATQRLIINDSKRPTDAEIMAAAETRELLQKVGNAGKVSDLKPELYQAVIDACRE